MEAILQTAELARTNNFDLLQEVGWQALRADLAEDFPYLTVQELSGIIKMGCKGKLDKYKSSPLNYTRIYQWVEQRTRFCLSYWQHHYPEATHWALHALKAEQLLLLLAEQPDLTKVTQSVYHSLIKNRVESLRYANMQHVPEQQTVYTQLCADFQAWKARYADYAARFTYQLFS